VKKLRRLFVTSLFCMVIVAAPTSLMADGNPLPICGNGACRPPAITLEAQADTTR
jgi:hypothetical protein